MKALTRIVLALVLLLVPVATQAHFKLLAPASWLIEDERGDPQKAAPCGGTNTDFGKPSWAVTQATGGSALHIRVQETIYHPGHYRVALAVNSPTELPVDPKATTMDTDRGPRSVSAEIMSPVQPPVLADGLFMHQAKADAPFETDVTLPNINCRRCTLQVIQFMEQHAVNNPGMFTYHHCATVQITADPKKPIDAA
ncbi:MAG TPA: SCE4755 family polysaccharide monooxygenase-like protein, partial [Vicinamibacterales bacterium]|nr:SCE4755 family polysaccharide monooxygenase-like protein [Vicinamibacterales bacterium]